MNGVPVQLASGAVVRRVQMTADSAVCGPDLERHVDAFAPYIDAGYDEVYVANTGPHWQGLFDLYAEHILPKHS